MRVRRIALAVLVLPLAGCGGGPSLYPVTGTVTQGGKAVADAEVVFIPDTKNADRTDGGGRTDSSGKYVAMFRDREGLAAGKYKIIIAQSAGSAESGALAERAAATVKQATRTAAQAAAESKAEESFDREVKTAGPNVFDFDLKKK